MRHYLTDTAVMVVFSTVCGAFVEIVIAGLTVGQSAHVRLAAIPVILLAGRPYGFYRDWLFSRLSGGGAGPVKAAIIDTIANVTFQAALYIGLLTLNGTTIGQISLAITSILVIGAVSGRPYGLFLTWCRRLSSISTP